jgi:hypothetical protein
MHGEGAHVAPGASSPVGAEPELNRVARAAGLGRQDLLASLAEEALAEYAAGLTKPL